MKRLVLVDDNPDYGGFDLMNLAGRGLPNVYTTTQVEGRYYKVEQEVTDSKGNKKLVKVEKFIEPSLTPDEVKNIFGNLGVGDAVMLIGPTAFNCLRKGYHFGIRGENYADCSLLKRLSIDGGAFVKCLVDLPEDSDIQEFMDPNFATPRDFSWFKQVIIHNIDDAIKFIGYMDGMSEDTAFGFDYEGSGLPWDIWYELSGFSLCTKSFGGFVSLTDLRHTTTKEKYEYFLYQVLAQFLVKRQSKIVVYNQSYEFQVSYRMLGVDLYNLCDASVFNVLSGNHLKKYSLKWSANMYLQSTVWDTEFDFISDLVHNMLFDETGTLKVTKLNFTNTPEWNQLANRYPKYVDEFKSLILEYWGNEYMCIPSDILGHYCNLDAFYTLMIYETEKTKYTDQAINVFLDNIRLQTFLHSSGVNKWEEYRQDYENYCKTQMAWGITYSAAARCFIKMAKHKSMMADINKYPKVAVKLLKKHKFFGGNPIDITKYIMSDNIDTMDVNELGINEGKIMMDYGPDFVVDFMTAARDAMEEAGMIKLMKKTGQKIIKNKIEGNIAGKKKFISIMAEKLKPIIGLDKIKINTKHFELEKYLYYEEAYRELMKIFEKQMPDINHIPSSIIAFGQKFNDLYDYSKYISDNYFMCTSPEENDDICLEYSKLYPLQTAYLAAINESTQQLNGAEKYYSNLGITNIDDAYNHFVEEYRKLCMKEISTSTLYPQKMFDLCGEYWLNIQKADNDKLKVMDQVKEVWDNFSGYTAQEQFFKSVSDDFESYGKPFSESDLSNNFYFMRKMVINYLLFKKYSKVMSTYIGFTVDGKAKGMFLATDKWVIEDPNTHIVIREATGPNEPGATRKMFAKFQCMEKSSKRWSSGYHTIVSHSDIKSTIRAYPGCLLSYFDIKY